MEKNYKNTRIRLLIAGILALLTAAVEASLYAFANLHLKEILQQGSVKTFFGLFTVTENAALANPHLTITAVCALLAIACFAGAHFVQKKSGN